MKTLFLLLAPLVLAVGQPAIPVMSDTAAARFLDQATWGPTPQSIAQLQQMGIADWLKAEFAMNPSDLPNMPVIGPTGKPYTALADVQRAFFVNALTQPDQLRQRVAFALSEIWVVSQLGGVNYAYAFPPYWRIFRDNAFGNYRDIIEAVTLSPAMGRYLNMANNNKADPSGRTSANENYARELLQLFTLGLTQLNADSTPVVDSNNNPVPTYDEAVIPQMAKVFTGWTYPAAPKHKAGANNPPYYMGQMYAVDFNHDETQKNIFGGNVIPAGQTAEQDLQMTLDDLMNQPTMAPFVCEQLIQHLVTSNPSPAYIGRVSNVFLNDGNGVKGNMKAVIQAILTDPEARAGDEPSSVTATAETFGHLREPILFLADILRGLDATLGNSSAIQTYAAQLGEDLFRAPSVFSYFSPQYRLTNGLLAPEFQLESTAAASFRADIVNRVLYGKLDASTKVDLSPFVAKAGDAASLTGYISYVFFHHAMPAAVAQQVEAAAEAQTTALAKAQAALYVALTSSEYQVVQ